MHRRAAGMGALRSPAHASWPAWSVLSEVSVASGVPVARSSTYTRDSRRPTIREPSAVSDGAACTSSGSDSGRRCSGAAGRASACERMCAPRPGDLSVQRVLASTRPWAGLAPQRAHGSRARCDTPRCLIRAVPGANAHLQARGAALACAVVRVQPAVSSREHVEAAAGGRLLGGHQRRARVKGPEHAARGAVNGDHGAVQQRHDQRARLLWAGPASMCASCLRGGRPSSRAPCGELRRTPHGRSHAPPVPRSGFRHPARAHLETATSCRPGCACSALLLPPPAPRSRGPRGRPCAAAPAGQSDSSASRATIAPARATRGPGAPGPRLPASIAPGR